MGIDIYENKYIRKWRVKAMLNYIKKYNKDSNVDSIINNYIKFVDDIDETEWEISHKMKIEEGIL